MNILSMKQSPIQASPAQTLDQLWHEAEQLGTIKADTGWSNGTYEVSITFKRKSGTRVIALGKNTSIAFALAAAINEAREMGAGIEQ